jgi:hypothetical protein
MGILTKSSEVLGSILVSILRLEPFFRDNIVTHWMFFTNSFGSRISIGCSKQVFTNKSFNVSGVPRHLLISDIMVWTTNPIFRKATHVSENLFIFVDVRNKVRTIQS